MAKKLTSFISAMSEFPLDVDKKTHDTLMELAKELKEDEEEQTDV